MPVRSPAALTVAAVLGGASLVVASMSRLLYLVGLGLVVDVAAERDLRARDRRSREPLPLALAL